MKPKRNPSQKDFKILLSFLTEKDPHTLSLVKEQLRDILKRNPRFKKLISTLKDPRLKSSAQNLIEEFRFSEIEAGFRSLAETAGDINLEEALYWIGKIETPSLTQSQISKPLDALAEKVDKGMAKTTPKPTKGVAGMIRVLFKEEGFEGNEKDYYNPKNIFLHSVLKRKKGIPISLSCVYMLVAWRMKALVHGVGLPGHYLVGHRVPRGVIYIDSFNEGRILRVKDCEVLVKRLGIPFRQSFLDPVNNRQTVARTILNLINLYSDQGKDAKAKWLAGLFQLLE